MWFGNCCILQPSLKYFLAKELRHYNHPSIASLFSISIRRCPHYSGHEQLSHGSSALYPSHYLASTHSSIKPLPHLQSNLPQPCKEKWQKCKKVIANASNRKTSMYYFEGQGLTRKSQTENGFLIASLGDAYFNTVFFLFDKKD